MIRVLLAGSVALAILLGCSHSPQATQAADPPTPILQVSNTSHVMAMCPMSVHGTQVTAADVEGGETLTFTTTTGEVAELRVRVRAMAERHNAHHADPRARRGMGKGMMASENPMAGSTIPPSRATVVDVDRGATIVVTPNVVDDLAKVQSTMRVRAERMQRNGCELTGQARR